jgi:L-cysteine/cystine lyase
MPDEEKLAAVRAALPAVEAGIYLNAGSVGPMPAETAKAMADLEAWELRTGRAHVDYFEEFLARMDEARGATAAVLGTDVDAIALNHSTTDGMNLAIAALDWRPGDRAVSSQLEHAGGVGPLHALRARLGVDLTLVDAGRGGEGEAPHAPVQAAITPGNPRGALAPG